MQNNIIKKTIRSYLCHDDKYFELGRPCDVHNDPEVDPDYPNCGNADDEERCPCPCQYDHPAVTSGCINLRRSELVKYENLTSV